MAINRQVVLKSFVSGVPTPEHFELTEEPVPEPGAGQILVRNLYLSLEPAIRSRLEGKAGYMPPIPIGGAIRGPTLGRIVESNLAGYRVGELLYGLNQWEDYSIVTPDTILLEKIQPKAGIPTSYYLGALGGSGLTAYVGLHEIGRIQPGETVVVSAAAGATGSLAGQIARLRGCKVIGIVGSTQKAQRLERELGFDAALNYRETPNLAAAVTALAPDGVDVYFDNVGGPTLDALFLAMKTHGRIVACGMISDYNRTDHPNPITHLWEIVARQLTMKGFMLFNHRASIPDARTQLERWVTQGQIAVLEHLTRGLSNAPTAYSELMSGKTTGKALVEIDVPEGAEP